MSRYKVILSITYVHSEHGLHFEVSRTWIQAKRERWRGNVPHGTHDRQCEKTDNGGGENRARRVFRVQVEGLPRATPRIYAAKPENGRVQPRSDVVRQSVFVRV